ncbi:Nucleosome-remodeling factor subunit NURF301 [Frankliniella fusca]|uniref:Nucleosome-remodeling factor subunit NURF301 n=1 Tax=Frankliniella fusca TaxID=407009 RepID=A0AAE1HLK6_9NEOP|nr:Nucleosome-remodeling factor subunit NURF301 [Frankliniella fusca]
MSTLKVGKKKETDDEVYCVCRKPFDDRSFMVCCCGCSEWFHGKCVGILEKQEPLVRKLDWHCTVCRSKIVTELQEAIGENQRLELENSNLMLIQIQYLKERSTLLKNINTALKDNSFIPSNGVDSNGVSVCQSHEVVQVAVENGRDGENGGINLEEETETASKREEAKYEKVDVQSNALISDEFSVISLTLDSEVENGMNNSEQPGLSLLFSQNTTNVGERQSQTKRTSSKRHRKSCLSLVKKHKYVDDDDDFDSTPKRIYVSQGLEW